MADNKQKTFKVSELTEIENLDDKDLFLVSDYEDGKCYTKKLTFEKLMNVLVNYPDLVNYILDKSATLDKGIETKVDEKVNEAFDIQTINGGDAFTVND